MIPTIKVKFEDNFLKVYFFMIDDAFIVIDRTIKMPLPKLYRL